MSAGVERLGPTVTDYDRYQSSIQSPSDNVMFLGDVLKTLKMSRPTLYRKMAIGDAPKPVQRIDNKSAWRKDEVLLYEAKRFANFKQVPCGS